LDLKSTSSGFLETPDKNGRRYTNVAISICCILTRAYVLSHEKKKGDIVMEMDERVREIDPIGSILKFPVKGLVAIAVLLLLLIFFGRQIVETVGKGTYQVKQAAITGTMSAKMTPGMWLQLFGDVTTWPKAETFFFTHDRDVPDDVLSDTSIEVRFNDGSLCDISGTLRIIMPTTEEQVLALVTERGHRAYKDLQAKLIQPHVRNVLRTTANLMSARDSYSDKRIQYVTWARDQIENGIYETETEIREVRDLVSGEMVKRSFQVIKMEGGTPVCQQNPLAGSGITIKSFEVKQFVYARKVQEQIATQQEALMAVATAKAEAERAEQDKLTIEAKGKAKVAQAKYEKEQEKIRAVVDAQKEKEVAETLAQKDLAVAKLRKQAAEQEKQRSILLGQGEGERKRLILLADGALQQKLSTYERVMEIWANAYAKRKVPSVMMGGGGAGGDSSNVDQNALLFNQALSLMALKQIGLDLTIPEGAKAGR